MNIRNQTIALTGMWQSLELVHQLAQHGELDAPQNKRFTIAIESLFTTTGDNAESVYGGLHNLEFGLHGFAHQLEQPYRRQQVMFYLVQVLTLQKTIAASRQISKRIAEGIADLQQQYHYFASDHEPLIRNIANIYLDTLGTLPMRQRIRVYGNKGNLSNIQVQHKVRTLLFSALRGAMLWRQMGGKRYLLLFQRSNIRKQLYKLI